MTDSQNMIMTSTSKSTSTSVEPVSAMRLLKRKRGRLRVGAGDQGIFTGTSKNNQNIKDGHDHDHGHDYDNGKHQKNSVGTNRSHTTSTFPFQFQLPLPLPPNIPILLNHNTSTSLGGQYEEYDCENENEWLVMNGNCGIVELSGEAGTGKTQIGLTMCLSAALSTSMASTVLTDIATDTDKSFRDDNPMKIHKQMNMNMNTNTNTNMNNSLSVSVSIPQSTDENSSLSLQNRNVNETSSSHLGSSPSPSPSSSGITNPYKRNKNAVHNPYHHHHQTSKTKKIKTSTFTIDSLSSLERNKNNEIPHSRQKHKRDLDMCTYYEAMYISLGETSSSSQIAHRLHQMTTARLQGQQQKKQNQQKYHYQQQKQQHCLKQDVTNVMNRIHTRFIHNDEEFMTLLEDELPMLLQDRNGNKNRNRNINEGGNTNSSRAGSFGTSTSTSTSSGRIGLIVLDSIAGLFRTAPEENSNITSTSINDDVRVDDRNNDDNKFKRSHYVKRSEMLFQIAARLKKLSDLFGVHILIINQVTSKGEGKVVPSLGLSWSHCVNDRYLLKRAEGVVATCIGNGNSSSHAGISATGSGTRFVRKIELLTSSRWKEGCHARFQIERMGAVSMREK